MTVLAVTGLRAEARLAQSVGLATLCCGGDPLRTAAALDAAFDRSGIPPPTGLISFGIAGGLDPRLASGAVVLGRTVSGTASHETYATDAAWSAAAAARAGAIRADIAGAATIVATADAKAELHRRTAAAAVDMESLVVARAASERGVPFIILRALADPAAHDLPSAALVPLTAAGTADLPNVLAAIARAPQQVPRLIRTALEARRALVALRRALHAIGPVALAPPSLERRRL